MRSKTEGRHSLDVHEFSIVSFSLVFIRSTLLVVTSTLLEKEGTDDTATIGSLNVPITNMIAAAPAGNSKKTCKMALVVLGNVVTMSPRVPRARGAAVAQGVIVALLEEDGDADEFCRRLQPRRVVSLSPQQVLLPGFVDPHSHFLGTGRNMLLCSLAGCEDLAVLLGRVQAWVATHMDDAIVLGVSYDDTKLREMRHPTRQELDSVSAGTMVVIQHISGHVGVANTAAMALATEHEELISELERCKALFFLKPRSRQRKRLSGRGRLVCCLGKDQHVDKQCEKHFCGVGGIFAPRDNDGV